VGPRRQAARRPQGPYRRGHQRSVLADGGRILTASSDKTARLDGKPLAILEGHTDAVTSAVFTPDSSAILASSDDDSARLWETFPQTQTLIDRVKSEVPRCLTPAQRQRFFLADAAKLVRSYAQVALL
jgi:WD40 repeat protein